jgi:tetratricopeptide (TPR) repeat protein
VAADLSLQSAKVIVDRTQTEEAFSKARDLVQMAVALNPTIAMDPDSYFRQMVVNRMFVEARSAAQNGDLKQATDFLEEIEKSAEPLNLTPDHDARTMVAQAKLSKALELFGRDRPSAMAELEKAVEVAPDYTVAHKLLATLYSESKEYGKAIGHLEIAARVTPEPDTLFQIAELRQQLANHVLATRAEESEAAVRFAQASLQVYPRYRCGYVSLGRIQYWREEYPESLQSLRKIDDTDFCYEDAMVLISAIYFDKQHDYERAYEIYKQARAQNPDYVGHLANLAEASLATKRYDNAYSLAEQALQRSPDRDTSVALAMRFIKIASLIFRGQNELADQSLRDFVEFYNRKVTPEFAQEWTFTGTENFIRHEESITAPQRDLLLKLLAVLQKPQASIRIQDFR